MTDQFQNRTLEQEVDLPESPPVQVKQNETRSAMQLIRVNTGGAQLADFSQVVDYAKFMAASQHAIPAHLQGNVGACIAVIEIAEAMGFSRYQVARMTYVVNGQFAFMAQLMHAMIERSGLLTQRLRFRYEGEGDTLKCICIGHFKGEVDPVEYETPEFKDITPKNSPLWKTDPKQQLSYFAASRWGRRYCPDVIMGIYTKEELEDGLHVQDGYAPGDTAMVVGSNVRERLRGGHQGEGFQPGHADRELEMIAPGAGTVIDDDAEQEQATQQPAEDKPATNKPAPTKKAATKPATAKKGTKGKEADKPAEGAAPAAAVTADKVETPDDYIAYVRGWMATVSDPEEAAKRWKDERPHRQRVGLPGKPRMALEKELQEKFGLTSG